MTLGILAVCHFEVFTLAKIWNYVHYDEKLSFNLKHQSLKKKKKFPWQFNISVSWI